MTFWELASLQLTLFAMMLIGALLRKKGIIDDNGKRCLSDLCINVVIPCNIFRSCLIEFNAGILQQCGMLLLCAVLLQVLCLVLNRFLFNRYAPQQRRTLEIAAAQQVMVITGGPGTGKTTTVRALIALFERLGLYVQLAAPTGRAAKRMTELSGREAQTIHRLLEAGYAPDSFDLVPRNVREELLAR